MREILGLWNFDLNITCQSSSNASTPQPCPSAYFHFPPAHQCLPTPKNFPPTTITSSLGRICGSASRIPGARILLWGMKSPISHLVKRVIAKLHPPSIVRARVPYWGSMLPAASPQITGIWKWRPYYRIVGNKQVSCAFTELVIRSCTHQVKFSLLGCSFSGIFQPWNS